MYDIGQTFFHEVNKQEFIVKKVNKELDLYACENTNPNKDSHGMPIMLTVYVTSNYINEHIDYIK